MSRISVYSLVALFVLAAPTLRAGSLDLSVSPAEVHPGEVAAIDVSGAPPGSRLILFASADPTPVTLGPFETDCGTFRLDLGLIPRLRLHGRSAGEDGGATFVWRLPRRLAGRFDGTIVYVQVGALDFSVDPDSGECSIAACASGVGSFVIRVP